jgi:hypothetical protein
MKQSNQMNELELKLRESQHQEKENNVTILRSIYDKVAQTPKWAKKLPVYFWVVFFLLTATLLYSLRLHYVIKDMAKAQFEKTELNRGLALKYHKNRSAKESGLRDQIEMLNNEIEDNRKQKYALRLDLKKATDLNAEQTQIIAKARSHDSAHRMLGEAYQTIAMNAVPLNLQQYIGVASNAQWVGYAQMASDRNAYNVINTVKSIPALMKIDKVATIVDNYNQAMDLADK